MKGKTVVLIDGMYLQRIVDSLDLSGKLDLERLSDELAGAHARARTYVFDALPPPYAGARQAKERYLKRINYLEKFQIETGYVKVEKWTCPSCRTEIKVPRQKKVDVLIATRLLECSYDSKIDRIILVAGDADFVPAVEVAKRKTKVALAYGATGTSTASEELKMVCDSRIELTAEYLGNCLREQHPRPDVTSG